MATKRWIAILALIGLSASGLSVARENGGVIYYTHIQGKVHVLLADHKGGGAKHSQRGWAGFGGKGSNSDTPESVAKREGNEEVKCIFDAFEISALFKDAPHDKNGSFTTYFVKVDYIDSAIFTLRKTPSDCSGGRERGPYAWVSWETLKRDIGAAKIHEDKFQLTIKRDDGERAYPAQSKSVYYNEFISSIVSAMNKMKDFPFMKFPVDSGSRVHEIYSKN